MRFPVQLLTSLSDHVSTNHAAFSECIDCVSEDPEGISDFEKSWIGPLTSFGTDVWKTLTDVRYETDHPACGACSCASTVAAHDV